MNNSKRDQELGSFATYYIAEHCYRLFTLIVEFMIPECYDYARVEIRLGSSVVIDECYERGTKMVIGDIYRDVLLAQELVVKVWEEEGKVIENGRIRVPLCLEKKRRYVGNLGVELELRIPLILKNKGFEVKGLFDSGGGCGSIHYTNKSNCLAKLYHRPVTSLAQAYADLSFRSELIAGAILPLARFSLIPIQYIKWKGQVGLLTYNGNNLRKDLSKVPNEFEARHTIDSIMHIGIRMLHSLGLMHRDIKPGNFIPLLKLGVCKLVGLRVHDGR